VLHDIRKAILHDPKQAQRHVLWKSFLEHRDRQTGPSRLCCRENSLQKLPKAATKPSVSNLYGVELVGQVMEVGRNFRGYLCNVVQLLLSLEREPDRVLRYLLQADLEQCHPLTQIVVQLSGDASAFLLLRSINLRPRPASAASASLRSVMSTNAITAPTTFSPSPLGMRPSIQRESLFIRPPLAPRLQRGLLLRFEMP